MSNSAIFNLLLADERNDKFFTASAALAKRLASVKESRKKAGDDIIQPTFRDIEKTHVNYLAAHYRPYVAVSAEYIKVKSSGTSVLTSSASNKLVFKFPIYGQFTSDMVMHIKTGALGSETASAYDPVYRWCAKPGLRMLQNTALSSDSKILDEYTVDDMLFKDKFDIPNDRRTAWDRGIGQAITMTGEYYNRNGFTGVMHYKDGLQTPKTYHAPTDLWVPLDFWMGKDASTALYNDLIPNTQREVTVTLAKLSQMVQALTQPSSNNEEPLPTTLPINKLNITAELYVCNLFVNSDIADIFEERSMFSLMRVHKSQMKTLNKSDDSILLNQLKFPAEYLQIGFRSTDNKDDMDHWCLFGKARSFTTANQIRHTAVSHNTANNMPELITRQCKEVENMDTLVDEFNIVAHGVKLFPDTVGSFFSSYLTQRYFEKTGIVSSKDKSAFLVPFCLYPGQNNPSGYYNMSTGREFCIEYKNASTITSSTNVEMIVSMRGMNFLIRDGDHCQLKYSV